MFGRTEALTGIVVGTFPRMGWRGAARGHRSDLLPVPRSEYLAWHIGREIGNSPHGRWRIRASNCERTALRIAQAQIPRLKIL